MENNKLLIKDIVDNQQTIKTSIENISNMQLETLSLITEKLEVIDNRLYIIEQKNNLFQSYSKENYGMLSTKMDNIQKILLQMEDSFSDCVGGNIKQMNMQNLQELKTEKEFWLNKLIETQNYIEDHIKSDSEAMDIHQKTKENLEMINESTARLSKTYDNNLQLTISKINEKLQELETNILKTKKSEYKNLLSSIDNVKETVLDEMKFMRDNEEKISETGIETSLVLQKVVGYIESLDEANRLIIAKLLLRDMVD